MAFSVYINLTWADIINIGPMLLKSYRTTWRWSKLQGLLDTAPAKDPLNIPLWDPIQMKKKWNNSPERKPREKWIPWKLSQQENCNVQGRVKNLRIQEMYFSMLLSVVCLLSKLWLMIVILSLNSHATWVEPNLKAHAGHRSSEVKVKIGEGKYGLGLCF